jgi:hypothetical protein
VSLRRPLALAFFAALGLRCGWIWPDTAEEIPVSEAPETERATRPGRERPAKEPPARAKGVKQGAGRRVRRNVGGKPGTVIFMVLDTVRADHTALCGYNRPNTPSLQSLVRAGATYTCGAYAPAPWTLPSHASFFTGTSVTEHATMFVAESDVAINPTITARPLAESFETLAEVYAERGYQTAAISANSIINDASGLLQGFEHIDVSATGLTMRGRALGQTLETRLDALDPEKPLFLFVNAYDAHDPYPPVPPGLDWIDTQPRTHIDAYTHDPANPYYAFIKGLMPEEDKASYLQTLRNGYDFGVYYADAQVGIVMTMLMRKGWLTEGYRVVVTSDHGEFLGEHDKLRHCGFVWEPVVKVPLVFFDSTRRRQPRLPEPISAIHAYHLVRDGYLPETPIPPHTVSEKNPEDIIVGTIAGAVWQDDEKAVCVDGNKAWYDLAKDPGELAPTELGERRVGATLNTLCEDIAALHELPSPQDDGGRMRDALKAMGYLDDAEAPPPPEIGDQGLP